VRRLQCAKAATRRWTPRGTVPSVRACLSYGPTVDNFWIESNFNNYYADAGRPLRFRPATGRPLLHYTKGWKVFTC